MTLIESKSLEDFRDKQLQTWQELLPNVNLNSDGMVYMDASVIAQILYLMEQDYINLAKNAFLAYATGDELSNLGKDRGILRKVSVKSIGEVTFARSTIAGVDYPIALGTIVSTQPDVNGLVLSFKTTEATILYGSILTPTGLAQSHSSSGGSLATGYFNYKVTAVSDDGLETDASSAVQYNFAGGSTNSITLTWNAVDRASSYKVYFASGASPVVGDFVLLASDILSATYLHTTGAGAGANPPVTNGTGNLSVDVAIEAVTGGAAGNVAANRITAFITKPTGIETVINSAAMASGSDEETDEDYRSRIKTDLSSNTGKVTVSGYEATASGVSGVSSATLVIPNGGQLRNAFNIYIVAEAGNGIPTAELLAAVQAEVTSDDNRAVCDSITVLAPDSHLINIALTLTSYDTSAFTDAQITAEIEENIIAYFKAIPVGSVMRLVDLSNVIHDSSGVIDFVLSTPSANVTLGSTEMAVLGTFSILTPSASVSSSPSPSSSISPSSSPSPSHSISSSPSASPSPSSSISSSHSSSPSPSASISSSRSSSPSSSVSSSKSASISSSPSSSPS